MAEEFGLSLLLDAKLKSGSVEKIKNDLTKGLSTFGVKPGKAADHAKDVTANITKGLGTSLKTFGSGGMFSGLKNILGIGMGAGVGAAGGMAVFEGMKSGIMRLYELMRQSSPIFQRSLKMIHMGILSMIRPFADTLGRIFMPISRFFMLWGRKIYEEYRKKYKEYVAGGMSPIEASIKASVESFTSGIVDLFTGSVNLTTIGEEILKGVVKSLEDPATFAGLLLIGGMVVGAVGLGLLASAITFTLAMQTVAWLIEGAAALGITGAGFGATMAGIAAGIGAEAGTAIKLVGWTGLFLGIGLLLYSEIEKGLKKGFQQATSTSGEVGYLPAPWTGIPIQEGWPQPWPPEYQTGGIFTKPTFGLIGEAGPEAVIPLSKMKSLGGTSIVVGDIHVSGTFNSEIDFQRAVKNAMDDYIREFTRGR